MTSQEDSLAGAKAGGERGFTDMCTVMVIGCFSRSMVMCIGCAHYPMFYITSHS